jgi:hypothetical protein
MDLRGSLRRSASDRILSRAHVLSSFVVAFLSLYTPVTAQVTTASYSGTVTDPSGAVIANAQIALTNQGTGTTVSKPTASDGSFQFDFVRVGAYTVRITAPGFKTLETKDIDLAGGASVRQTFALQLGQVSETVAVESTAPLVNAVSSEQSQSVTTLEASELPLSKRNVSNLLGLGTGVSPGAGFVRLNGVGKTGTLVHSRWNQRHSRPGKPDYVDARELRTDQFVKP